MREPLVPRTRAAHLGRAGLRREASDRVHVPIREPRPEQLLGRRLGTVRRIQARLQPQLVERRSAPVGEEADAVGRRDDLLEMVDDLRQREVFVHDLAHPECRLDLERHAADDAERTERDDRPMQGVAGCGAVDPFDLTIGPDDLHRRRGGRQVGVPDTRPVTGGRARARDRDMRQRGEIGQREPRRLEELAQLAIALPATDRDRPGRPDPGGSERPGERARRDRPSCRRAH